MPQPVLKRLNVITVEPVVVDDAVAIPVVEPMVATEGTLLLHRPSPLGSL